MKKFIINISYSWGEEENPIEIEAENKWDAFAHMCNLALKEFRISHAENPEYFDNGSLKVFPEKVVLHYGYDDEECYYELKEEI